MSWWGGQCCCPSWLSTETPSPTKYFARTSRIKTASCPRLFSPYNASNLICINPGSCGVCDGREEEAAAAMLCCLSCTFTSPRSSGAGSAGEEGRCREKDLAASTENRTKAMGSWLLSKSSPVHRLCCSWPSLPPQAANLCPTVHGEEVVKEAEQALMHI